MTPASCPLTSADTITQKLGWRDGSVVRRVDRAFTEDLSSGHSTHFRGLKTTCRRISWGSLARHPKLMSGSQTSERLGLRKTKQNTRGMTREAALRLTQAHPLTRAHRR